MRELACNGHDVRVLRECTREDVTGGRMRGTGQQAAFLARPGGQLQRTLVRLRELLAKVIEAVPIAFLLQTE